MLIKHISSSFLFALLSRADYYSIFGFLILDSVFFSLCHHKKIMVREPLSKEDLVNSHKALNHGFEKGRKMIVSLLLALGIDINALDSEGFSLLHDAARTNQQARASLLLAYGADLEVQDAEGHTPLCWAIIHNHSRMSKFLIGRKAKLQPPQFLGETLFHLMNWNKDLRFMDQFFPMGSQSNYAAEKKKIARLLLRNGVDLYATDNKGNTFLHCAAANGKTASVEFFIQMTLEASNTSNLSEDPPEKMENPASSSKSPQLIHCINAQNHKKETPLFLAAQAGYVKLVEMLLLNHADNTLVDRNGSTPCHAAAECNHVKIIRLLLKFSSPINAVDNNGKTALVCAIEAKASEAISLLLDYNAYRRLCYSLSWKPTESSSSNLS